jgi:eukaryotic-like serine/threonine-protein kinase
MHSKPDPLIGTIVAGRYRILEPLGKGGMGVVYLAVHEAIEKKVALKVLRREYSLKSDIVTRFQQEAISASRIKHPNVLDVFDFGQLDDGSFFLAMEFLEGHDLARELKGAQKLEPERAVFIAIEVCRALAAAHSRGVVHRDLKPENVFLQRSSDGDAHVKIVDFGIAQLRSTEEAAEEVQERRRLTRTGMIFGTPEYMAPEQAEGRDADLRADIYALGVILYEMCTGAVPFTGETFIGVLTSHLHKSVPPMREVCPELDISEQLEALILQALEKKPESRPQSMSEVAGLLSATPEARRLALPARQPSMPEVTPFKFKPSEPPASADTAPLPLLRPTSAGARTSLGDDRSNTQLEAETQPGPKARSRSGVVLLAAVLAAAGVATALFFLYDPRGIAAEVTPEPAPAAPAPAPTPAPAAPEPEADERVRLHVTSEPSEAVVFKSGFQVCDATPCEVLAKPDEPLVLEARKGELRGSAKVLAHRSQKIHIELTPPEPAKPAPGPRPAAVQPPPPKPPPKPALCEVDVDGLKILRPCE